MKIETFTCDICDFKTNEKSKVFDAYLSVGTQKHIIHAFHVCTTCYTQTPKGVFTKAFNALIRLLGAK